MLREREREKEREREREREVERGSTFAFEQNAIIIKRSRDKGIDRQNNGYIIIWMDRLVY